MKTLTSISIPVDLFNDERLMMVTDEFGYVAELVYLHLLSHITRRGYCVEWNSTRVVAIARELPGVDRDKLDAMVRSMVRWGLFHKASFNRDRVLTSRAIQTEYIKANRNADLSSLPYLFVTAEEVFPPKPAKANSAKDKPEKNKPATNKTDKDLETAAYSHDTPTADADNLPDDNNPTDVTVETDEATDTCSTYRGQHTTAGCEQDSDNDCDAVPYPDDTDADVAPGDTASDKATDDEEAPAVIKWSEIRRINKKKHDHRKKSRRWRPDKYLAAELP